MDDRAIIVGEMAVEKGLFLEFAECSAVAIALAGQELTPDAVAKTAYELWPDLYVFAA